jgi:predicted nucleotidyltransferase
MEYGLNTHTIKAIQRVLAGSEGIEKAIIYGSRAKGNYRTGSDIDLTLVAPALGLRELLEIENKLDDLLLPYKIDISLQHQIENQELLKHIERVGAIFYEKDRASGS